MYCENNYKTQRSFGVSIAEKIFKNSRWCVPQKFSVKIRKTFVVCIAEKIYQKQKISLVCITKIIIKDSINFRREYREGNYKKFSKCIAARNNSKRVRVKLQKLWMQVQWIHQKASSSRSTFR